MPFTFTVDESRRLVRIAAEGEIHAGAWFATLTEAFADPRYHPGFDLLYDRTLLSNVPDTRTVRVWIDAQARAMRDAGAQRMAIVVSQPVVYGMMRMAGAFAESAGFWLKPYWTEAEALTGLGHDRA